MWSQRLIAPRTFEPGEAPTLTAADLKPDQVLLRVLAGGICGSDLPQYKGIKSSPILDPSAVHGAQPWGHPMHEVTGEVIASTASGLEPGTKVVGWATGFDGIQELVISNASDVAPYDPALPASTAVLLQPLACVMYAVEQIGSVAGQHAAVIGQGPIGVLFSHVLKSAGASRVTGVDLVDRSDVAATFGVDDAVRAGSTRWSTSVPESEQPGVVVEAVGHQVGTLTDAVTAAGFGGRIFYFGIPDDAVYPLPMTLFLRKNLSLRSGTTRERVRMLTDAGDYLKAHPELAARYVTDVIPVDKVQEAYERAIRPAPGQLKIVVDMG